MQNSISNIRFVKNNSEKHTLWKMCRSQVGKIEFLLIYALCLTCYLNKVILGDSISKWELRLNIKYGGNLRLERSFYISLILGLTFTRRKLRLSHVFNSTTN